jgi:plastocyanin
VRGMTPRWRRSALAALELMGIALLMACSEHQDPMGPSNGTGQVVEVELLNFEFSPPELHIEVGTTVRWTNTTSNFHTVTPDGHTAWIEWQTAGEGETFEVMFDEAGAYPYYCVPHRGLGMAGTIIVE